MSNPAAKAASRLWLGIRLPRDCDEILADSRYHHFSFCRLYLAEGEKLLAEGSVAEALAALRCAPRLVAKLRMAESRDDLQLRAWALLGSAGRAAGEPGEAAAAFARAAEIERQADLRAAGGARGLSPAVRADFYRRHAAFLAEQDQIAAAAGLLGRAIELLAGGPPGSGEAGLGGLIFDRGLLHLRERRFDAAIDDFGLALARLDPKRSPQAYFAAARGLAQALELAPELALVNRATRWLRAARDDEKGRRGSLARFRLYCIEAEVLARVGSTRRAQKHLLIARKGFLRGRAFGDLLLATLQLADLLHGEGRFAELEGWAEETLAACRGRLAPEVEAALAAWGAAAAAGPEGSAELAAASRELRAWLAAGGLAGP